MAGDWQCRGENDPHVEIPSIHRGFPRLQPVSLGEASTLTRTSAVCAAVSPPHGSTRNVCPTVSSGGVWHVSSGLDPISSVLAGCSSSAPHLLCVCCALFSSPPLTLEGPPLLHPVLTLRSLGPVGSATVPFQTCYS